MCATLKCRCHHASAKPLQKCFPPLADLRSEKRYLEKPLLDRFICLPDQYKLILDRIMCMLDQLTQRNQLALVYLKKNKSKNGCTRLCLLISQTDNFSCIDNPHYLLNLKFCFAWLTNITRS